MPILEEPKIVIKGLTEGLYPEYYLTTVSFLVDTATEMTDNQYPFSNNFDPISEPGTMRPAVDYIELTNNSVVGNKIVKFILDARVATAYLYALEDGPKLHKINTSTKTIQNSGGFPHTIAGTGVFGEDLAIYTVNGQFRLFYAYRSTTPDKSDIGIFDFSTTFDDDFMSTVPSGATTLDNDYPVRLFNGDNGFLYIGNGNVVHKFDGTTAAGSGGKLTQVALDLPAGFVIKAGLSHLSHLWLGADSSFGNDVKVFIWNYQSIQSGNLNGLESIKIEGAEEIFNMYLYNNRPRIWVRDLDGSLSLREYTGSDFEIIQRLKNVSDPVVGGNALYKGMMIWNGNNGLTFAIGNLSGKRPNSFHQFAQLGNGALFVYGGIIYTSSGSNMYYYTFSSGNIKASSFYTKVYELPKNSEIVGINFWWKKFTGGTDLANALTIDILTNNMLSTDSSRKTIGFNYHEFDDRNFKFIPLAINKTHNVQLKVSWNFGGAGYDIEKVIKFTRIEILYKSTTKKV
jgi:hypothetical protein